MTIDSGDDTSEAMRPAEVGLANAFAAAPARNRGRPPGSRNRSTINRESTTVSPTNIIPPRRRSTPTSLDVMTDVDKEAEAKRKKQAKENQAKVYGAFIANQLNDYIMMAMQGIGVPQEWLYAPGQAPTVSRSTKYGPMGNQIAIPPMMAESWGKLLSELANTEQGSKIAGFGDNPLAAIGLNGILAMVTTAQWFSSFNKIMKILPQQIELYKLAQAQAVAEEMAKQNGSGA